MARLTDKKRVLPAELAVFITSRVARGLAYAHAKTGKDGKALLTDLSPRVYVVRVWHPQLEGTEEATKKNVDASRSRSVEVAWTVKLKPEARIRRAPVADRSGRY